MSGKETRKVMKALDDLIGSKRARLIVDGKLVDGKLVDEVPLPSDGTPKFRGYKVEEPGDGVEPNALVEVVVKDGQKQSYPAVATPQ